MVALEKDIRKQSPFFSRNYGGFTKEQIDFCISNLDCNRRQRILDPMAGQAYYFSDFVNFNKDIWIGDLNPAPLLLAFLRNPELFKKQNILRKYLKGILNKIPKYISKQEIVTTDEWFSESVKDQLFQYGSLIRSNYSLDPYNYENFWNLPYEEIFLLSIPILSARELTCYSLSDNKTWIKKGGITRVFNIHEILIKNFNDWLIYINGKILRKKIGKMFIQRMNTTMGNFGSAPKVDYVFTSPPFANRLDYTQLWAPELAVLSLISSEKITEIKKSQIGSNVIKDNNFPLSDLDYIPSSIKVILNKIKNDNNKASKTYYYPYFNNYAISLSKSLYTLAGKIKNEVKIIIFVRSTVRKDILFPTEKLVNIVLKKLGFKLEKTSKQKVIKNHIGNVRIASSKGVYGLAQQEYWLSFKRIK